MLRSDSGVLFDVLNDAGPVLPATVAFLVAFVVFLVVMDAVHLEGETVSLVGHQLRAVGYLDGFVDGGNRLVGLLEHQLKSRTVLSRPKKVRRHNHLVIFPP